MRVADQQCADPIVPADVKTTKERLLTADEVRKGRLCLRVAADIDGRGERRRVTSRLNLDNNTYRTEIETEFRRVAEAVIGVADPVTASLHHMRRSGGGLVRAGVVMDARGTATEAARAAERRNFVSRCWGKNLLARLALDEGDFRTADTHLRAAAATSILSQVLEGNWPGRCYQHTQFTWASLYRRVLRSDETDEDGLSVLPATEDDKKEARRGLAEQARGYRWPDLLTKWEDVAFGSEDQREAAAIILAEMHVRDERNRREAAGIAQAAATESSCPLTLGPAPAARAEIGSSGPAAANYVENRIGAWADGAASTGDLAERAAVRYVRALGRLDGCEPRATVLAERLARALPGSGNALELLGDQLVAEARRAAATGSPQGKDAVSLRSLLDQAGLRYRQAVHGAPDEEDMQLLLKLASVQLALAPRGENGLGREERASLVLLQEAVRRFERALYPEHQWEVAYQALSRWAALVLVAYGETDAPGPKEVKAQADAVLARMPLLGVDIQGKDGVASLLTLDKIGDRIACTRMALSATTSGDAQRYARVAQLVEADETFELERRVKKGGCPATATANASPATGADPAAATPSTASLPQAQ